MDSKPKLTLTGADEKTDIQRLARVEAEIGVLYTANPNGRNRYPGREWIERESWNIPHLSIHVCGSRARHELVSGLLEGVVAHASRIQVNGTLTVQECQIVCDLYPNHTVITQHRRENESLIFVKASNHALLVDGSGGRGVSPETWPHLTARKPVGYAGGLGVSNLEFELHRITEIAAPGWWVDMEQKLRVGDWFSVCLAEEVSGIFGDFLSRETLVSV